MTIAELNAKTQALLIALKARSLETGGHMFRVAQYSVLLGREYGLSNRELVHLRYGALLHDIGKLGILDSVLNKPAKLTADEYHHMKSHPTTGAVMLHALRYPKEIVRVIQQHHEWFDGSGYPNKLKGSEISILARIFSVADALDAITSTRCYREGRGYSVAKQEILDYSGKQFDPEVVAAFLAIPPDQWNSQRSRSSRDNTSTSTGSVGSVEVVGAVH
jgi:putative nucleotidyltransferase with HDIG domain